MAIIPKDRGPFGKRAPVATSILDFGTCKIKIKTIFKHFNKYNIYTMIGKGAKDEVKCVAQ